MGEPVSILDPLVQLLEENNVGDGGRRGDIFRFVLPEDVSDGILLRTPGDGVSRDPYVPGFVMTRVQGLVRSPSFDDGLGRAWDVYRALTLDTRRDVAGVRLKQLYPVNEPVGFPRAAGSELEFSVNFELSCVRLDT